MVEILLVMIIKKIIKSTNGNHFLAYSRQLQLLCAVGCKQPCLVLLLTIYYFQSLSFFRPPGKASGAYSLLYYRYRAYSASAVKW